MNKLRSMPLLVTLVAPLMLWLVRVEDPPPLARAEDPSELAVMTFNLRYASPDPPNSWPTRRPVMRALFADQEPDVIGTQEGLYSQVKDLAADLPAYDWIGQGREGGSRGEFMAIFYRKDRLEPLEFDHFWLSDTPETAGSRTWGNWLPRMVTWVRFRDRQNGQQFYFFNTHLDHLFRQAREKSVMFILRRVQELRPELPVMLVGDFNATAGDSKEYKLLTGPNGFTDTWATALQRGANIGTFHNYRGPTRGGRRIDWILSRGSVTALASEVVTFAEDGQYPSDHFPVVARVRIGANSP